MKTKNLFGDERIEQLHNRYTSYAFYGVLIYVMISTLVKMFVLDPNIPLMVFYDVFIVVMVGCAYITWKGIKEGTLSARDIKKEERVSYLTRMTIMSVIFGFFMAFFVFELDGGLVAITENWLQKTGTAFMMAIYFGVALHFSMKWIARRSESNVDKMMEED